MENVFVKAAVITLGNGVWR